MLIVFLSLSSKNFFIYSGYRFVRYVFVFSFTFLMESFETPEVYILMKSNLFFSTLLRWEVWLLICASLSDSLF